ncbi:MAG: FAD-binding oxidoreductase [Chloroflexi bacterium]|nr:FAD-binding oxidoreductase [Chloroflexota bacterium]
MNRFADVVIVGGGVMGCSAAFHLARGARVSDDARPLNARIVVVEKGSVASGMTKRSGGLMHASLPDETQAQLAWKSLEYVRNWKSIVGGECAFIKTGLLALAPETVLREQATMLARIGAPAQTLSADELREFQPGVNADDAPRALFEPDAGYVDPMQMAQSLAARAKEYGAEFRTGTLAKSIRVEHGRVTGIETTTGTIETLAVVVMAGAWSERLLKPLGIELGMRVARTQVAFFDRPAELKKGHPAFFDAYTGAYFRPHTFGLLYAGMIEPNDENVNPDHFDESVSPAFVNELRQRIVTRLPVMANARYVRGHAGVYDVTAHAHPIIGKAPAITGLFVAAGFGGYGLALAPAVGACVAELVTEGAASTVELKEFQVQ